MSTWRPGRPPHGAESGPALDAARRQVVERDLVATAFGHLTADAFMALPFEALAPTKGLLKRFFSSEPWGPDQEEALAAAVGPGEGHWRRQVDAGLWLDYGWEGGRFRVTVDSEAAGPAESATADPLADTFDGPVVPEATPNPRTIRFHVGPIHDGPSRWYESASQAEDDPGASRLFAEFPDVANVLVGPDFVAVGLHRPSDWERLLRPVLAAVTDEFASPDGDGRADPPRVMGGPAGAGATAVGAGATAVGEGATGEGAVPSAGGGPRLSRLQRAWRELGSLRPADGTDLSRVRAAASGDDPSYRQVAANLLREADPQVAAADWARLVHDPVRAVRRAAVDAMVDVGRESLRPLLEGALGDTDAWVRWKALRGLAQIGAGPSRDAISGRQQDPDFRVRLEVAAALRSLGG